MACDKYDELDQALCNALIAEDRLRFTSPKRKKPWETTHEHVQCRQPIQRFRTQLECEITTSAHARCARPRSVPTNTIPSTTDRDHKLLLFVQGGYTCPINRESSHYHPILVEYLRAAARVESTGQYISKIDVDTDALCLLLGKPGSNSGDKRAATPDPR